jgi:hypothetical protein
MFVIIGQVVDKGFVKIKVQAGKLDLLPLESLEGQQAVLHHSVGSDHPRANFPGFDFNVIFQLVKEIRFIHYFVCYRFRMLIYLFR